MNFIAQENYQVEADMKKLFFWLAWVAIVVVYILLRINLIDIPLDRDEGGYGYMGQLILDGGIPYKDAVNHKPPMLYYIYAFALLFVPSTARGIHVFLHFYNFLSLISLYFVTRIYFRSVRTGFWAALSFAVISAGPGIQGFTAATEMFMLLPIILCLLFAVVGSRNPKLVFFLLSGVFGALACWTKPQAVTSVAFVGAYLIFARHSSKTGGGGTSLNGVIKPLVAWAAGGAAISLLITGYFYHKGVFEEFIYWIFTHNFIYAGHATVQSKIGKILGELLYILKGDFIIICAGLLFGLINIFKGKSAGLFVLGFLVFSFLGTVPGYAYTHYFAQLAPALALAAAPGFSSLCNAFSKRQTQRFLAASLCAALVVAIPVMVHAGYYLETSGDKISRDFFGSNPFPESKELADFISGRTTRDDTVFIFGSEAQILFYSRRKSAIPFIFIYPLTQSFPRNLEFQEKAWEDIKRREPEYIVLVNIALSIAWDGKAERILKTKVDRLIEMKYELEAVSVVGSPKGKLIILPESEWNLIKEAFEKYYMIYAYRRRAI